MNRSRGFLLSCMLAAPLLVQGSAGAEDAKPEGAVAQLLAKDPAGVPGKEAVMLTVVYPPGGASAAHRHDANVFVYVLEGTLRMQVDGGPAVTLERGDTFYEKPQDVHRVSANASKTEPVKFLVVMIKDKGKPATRPAE